MSRYFYEKIEEIPKNETLNIYQHLFENYKKSIPSLTESLNQMYLSINLSEQKANELTKSIITKCENFINDIYINIKDKYPIIEKEEAIIISSYSCEAFDSKYSPYKILNRKLNEENREEGIKQISKYLFIFLKALRKLDRYYPKQKYMYRCINQCVKLKEDYFDKAIIPYQKGVNKTFYGFTSITTKICTSYNLNGKQQNFEKGTVFSIYGDFFGYDITIFNSSLVEEEIILEPEISFIVESAINSKNIIHIKCKYEKYNKVLEDIIKPDGMRIVYKLNREMIIKEAKTIKIFGTKFVDNNIDTCKIVHKNKLYDLTFYFDISKFVNDTLEITLFGFQNNINVRYLFENCTFLSSLPDLLKINFSSIYDLGYLFCDCRNIISLPDISKLDISHVTDISHMFEGCESLKSLPDLSKWNTINLRNASSLFRGCKSLIELPDISKWNFYNPTDISHMFDGCESLSSFPDLSKWNTINLIDISYLFSGCISLTSLPEITKWNISNVINASYLFNGLFLSSLPDISTWNMIKINNIAGMFSNCKRLEHIPDISKWNTYNINNMSYLFNDCISVRTLPDISKWKTPLVQNMSYMFSNCVSLVVLPDISKWETKAVNNMEGMFKCCKSLNVLPDLSKWNVLNVHNMKYMFCNCQSLITLPNILRWYLIRDCNREHFILNCYSLSEVLDLSLYFIEPRLFIKRNNCINVIN